MPTTKRRHPARLIPQISRGSSELAVCTPFRLIPERARRFALHPVTGREHAAGEHCLHLPKVAKRRAVVVPRVPAAASAHWSLQGNGLLRPMVEMMSDLFSALIFGVVGTFFLMRRDRLIAANLEAYRRFPFLRRIPILGRWPDASARFHRREALVLAITFWRWQRSP